MTNNIEKSDQSAHDLAGFLSENRQRLQHVVEQCRLGLKQTEENARLFMVADKAADNSLAQQLQKDGEMMIKVVKECETKVDQLWQEFNQGVDADQAEFGSQPINDEFKLKFNDRVMAFNRGLSEMMSDLMAARQQLTGNIRNIEIDFLRMIIESL